MIETFNCPDCGELLEIPVQMLGQPVRCGACANVFTPQAWRFNPDDSPVPSRSERRRRENPEGSRATRRILFVVIAFFGLMVVACCGGLGFFAYALMHPNWQAYDSPTGEFTSKFPGATQPGTRLTGRGGETATVITARRKFFQEEYFVYFIALPNSDIHKPADRLLTEFAEGLKSQNPGNSEYRGQIRRQHEGHEAIDVCLELIDDRFATARVVIVANKEKKENRTVYVIGVIGPNDPNQSDWVEEFIDAFHAKEPENPEKPVIPRNPFRKQP